MRQPRNFILIRSAWSASELSLLSLNLRARSKYSTRMMPNVYLRSFDPLASSLGIGCFDACGPHCHCGQAIMLIWPAEWASAPCISPSWTPTLLHACILLLHTPHSSIHTRSHRPPSPSQAFPLSCHQPQMMLRPPPPPLLPPAPVPVPLPVLQAPLVPVLVLQAPLVPLLRSLRRPRSTLTSSMRRGGRPGGQSCARCGHQVGVETSITT